MRRSSLGLLSIAAALGAIVPSSSGRALPGPTAYKQGRGANRPTVSRETEKQIIAKAKARRAARNMKRLQAKANGGCN